MENKIEALVLFSGGLDSMLAVKALENQGIEVTAVCFYSNFFSCKQAEAGAKEIGVPLLKVDLSDAMIELVKDPPSGHGKRLNPCIDCHALMVRKAGEMMVNPPHPLPTGQASPLIKGVDKFDIIASGEVLGQRPFSQNKEALQRVSKLAGLEILRPLSAKLLDETEYERSGLVDRNQLFAISGRGRHKQIKMAEEFGIRNYASPAGGCFLTQDDFSARLKVMLSRWPDARSLDVELLKYGRVFWLQAGNFADEKKKGAGKTSINEKSPPPPAYRTGRPFNKGGDILAVIGRNEADNEQLEKLAQKGDFMLQLKEINGPTAIFRGLLGEYPKKKSIRAFIPADPHALHEILDSKTDGPDETMDKMALITGFFAPKARGAVAEVELLKF